MQPSEFLSILSIAEQLKCNTRHSWTSSGRHESVAEHSWRITLMAMLCADEFPDLDMNRVIRMCLIHDLGEAFTGDIPAFDKTDSDEDVEEQKLFAWVDTLPEATRQEFRSLYTEMAALETKEARLYKALDKLEALIQHDEADISTWLPLEYDLQLTYGADLKNLSPWLRSLRDEVDRVTREKIAAAKKDCSEP